MTLPTCAASPISSGSSADVKALRALAKHNRAFNPAALVGRHIEEFEFAARGERAATAAAACCAALRWISGAPNTSASAGRLRRAWLAALPSSNGASCVPKRTPPRPPDSAMAIRHRSAPTHGRSNSAIARIEGPTDSNARDEPTCVGAGVRASIHTKSGQFPDSVQGDQGISVDPALDLL